MLDSKLIKLLQVLTSKELLEVERQMSASKTNSKEDVQKLFAMLIKYSPDYDSPKIAKERLFAKLFGKQPYNDGKMRKLMTQLTQLIEQFLIAKELSASEDVQAKLLARALAGRQHYELFLDVVESRLKELDRGIERGRDYFREGYELSEMLYYHPGTGKSSKRGEYYERAISDLERYFTLVMLQNEADSIVRTRLVREHKSSAFLKHVMDSGLQPEFDKNGVVYFFRYIIMLLNGEIEGNLDELRDTAFKNFEKLNRFEQDFALNLLRNYAVPMSNKGSLPHRRFVFELYKMEIDQMVLANTIASAAFMNIVSVGLAVEELDWVKNFLENYADRLPEEEMEMTLNYCNGVWCYQKGLRTKQLECFYDGLQFLNLIPIRTGPNYELRVRPTMIRIHFEIFERGKETLDGFLNQVRNFERHLSGSLDYASPIKDSYLHFFKYCKMLARLVNNREDKRKTIIDFAENLNASKLNIALKPWLLEKANELVAKY
ncbi:MAG: hypothetical protein IT258_22540 [Saprospiraceae bacterium]|nr:hypothetical protein [Saprospiraceae bacterium]